MRNKKRPTRNETDKEQLEDLGASDAGIEREEPGTDGVPFYETLDAETRAQVDEVLELSKALARNVVAALNRGGDAD
jgi:hypothetical protein